jgi:antirestriction protein ArdC
MSKNEKIYEVINSKIIQRLESALKNGERFSWVKPWSGICQSGNAIEWKKNPKKYRGYRGINALLLDGLYLTYTQLQEFAAKHPEKEFKIKKGTKQQTVYFYKLSQFLNKDEDEEGNETLVTKKVPLIRFYNVYSIQDITNLADYFKVEEYKHDYNQAMENADKVIKEWCSRDEITFIEKEGSDRCYYSPSNHSIVVPPKKAFKNPYEAFSAYLHECVHSTMRSLNRPHGMWGEDAYSQEELCAEIGSSMMMGALGLDDSESFSNSISYLQGWLTKLSTNQDMSFIVKAANAAQRAVDLILGIDIADSKNDTDAA